MNSLSLLQFGYEMCPHKEPRRIPKVDAKIVALRADGMVEILPLSTDIFERLILSGAPGISSLLPDW